MARTVSFNHGSKRTLKRIIKGWIMKSVSVLLTKTKNLMNDEEECEVLIRELQA